MDQPTPAGERARRIVGNLLLWTVICSIAAAPSFIIASTAFDTAGMLVGVILFILAYTLVASTEWAQRLKAQPAIRLTLMIGYGTRVAVPLPILAVAAGASTGGPSWEDLAPIAMVPVVLVDLLPGIISTMVAGGILRGTATAAEGFTGTLIITLVQGTVLNLMLGVYMLVVYAIVRLFVGKRHTGALQCSACGYDLRGSQGSETCPECGEPAPWSFQPSRRVGGASASAGAGEQAEAG